MRGLKQKSDYKKKFNDLVAPYVGAWIETFQGAPFVTRSVVAPYVGAWIETLIGQTGDIYGKSHPTWVRGLKLPSRF